MKRLEKLKMPPMKKQVEEELDFDALEASDEEESEDEEAMEEEADFTMEEDSSEDPLADLSDEELLAELKRRGLAADSEAPDGEGEEDDYESIVPKGDMV
jgi:hypothetical protein